MNIRVRYAPSPTGLQHIGGIRTALFNYLFARCQNGKFILRQEDTDQNRFDEKYVKNIYDSFAWLGLQWDEGPDKGGPFAPYIQSRRNELYKKYACELLKKGQAYYCFCSADRIEKIRQEREAAHSSLSGYDRYCRNIPEEKAIARAASGETYTIRLKIPLNETTVFHDFLLGDIEWKNDDINPDPVLLKSDSFPTYHLANVVDDHLMEISHVLRAQEWLSSTPLHVIMYNCFGWKPPEYCHLPLVMGHDGKKLSKRHGATSIDEFRLQGFLPEALLNYIAMLGASWEEGRSDIYSLQELENKFSMEKLNKAQAIFDYKKLEWFNGQYIRMKSSEELASLCLPFALEKGLFGAAGAEPSPKQMELFIKAMPLIRERMTFLNEAAERINYLFKEPDIPPPQEFIPKKASLIETIRLLGLGRKITEGLVLSENDAAAEVLIKEFSEKESVKLGDLMMPLRVAITGTRVSPPLFGSLRLLGIETSLMRIGAVLSFLENSV